MNANSAISSDVLFVADSLVLDFINSAYGVGEQHHDCLTDDESVISWLKLAGQLPEAFDDKTPNGLVAQAHELREQARAAIQAGKDGVKADLAVINRVLESGRPVRELAWDEQRQAFGIVTGLRDHGPASLLEPVAASLVNLLTGGKLELVKQCEAQDCVLFFHDLTKSHRRRWCSMATCGNRMKVAAFRSRKQKIADRS